MCTSGTRRGRATRGSGLYAARGPMDGWTIAQVRPVVETALELFGPDRLIYGGDWPISELAGGYARTWEATRRHPRRTACRPPGMPCWAIQRRASTDPPPRHHPNERGWLMRQAAYIGNHQIAVDHGAATGPAAGEVQIARRLHRPVRHRSAHPPRQHGCPGRRTPLVFGHEMSGTIAAVGDGRRRAGRSATRVTVMPLDWDGTCPACLAGNSHICQNLDFIGIDSPGALQELWNVPRRAARARCPTGSRSTTPRSSSPSPSRCTTCAARSSTPATRPSSSAAGRSAC